jgi:HlyD family secretion protein
LAAISGLAVFLAVGEPVVATLRLPRSPLEGIPTASVRRTDLLSRILAPGRVASSQSTEIRCTLERLDAGSLVNGASTILTLIPDGTTVEAGQVLCELDSSSYQELLRRQQIVVEQAVADHLQAALGLEVAELALQSYREGERLQVVREYKGQIALAQADLSRQADRIDWARRMLEKGYVSVAQVRTEEATLERLKAGLERSQLAVANFERFTVPKMILALDSDVVGARSTLGFQTIRLNRERDRLEHYRKLLEGCTVRAPHGGFVIYANRPNREPRVYEGAPVRERMQLFTLPDQSKMEVEVLLHETVVQRVRPGMGARIVIEALPGHVVDGHLASVSPLPLSDRSAESGNDITFFMGHVQLDHWPEGLRPGMTAQTTILSGLRQGVLAVPTMAVTVEDQQEVCYVDHEDSVERRPVKVTQATEDYLEVIEGLSEGEEVVVDPSRVSASASRERLSSALVQ